MTHAVLIIDPVIADDMHLKNIVGCFMVMWKFFDVARVYPVQNNKNVSLYYSDIYVLQNLIYLNRCIVLKYTLLKFVEWCVEFNGIEQLLVYYVRCAIVMQVERIL